MNTTRASLQSEFLDFINEGNRINLEGVFSFDRFVVVAAFHSFDFVDGKGAAVLDQVGEITPEFNIWAGFHAGRALLLPFEDAANNDIDEDDDDQEYYEGPTPR